MPTDTTPLLPSDGSQQPRGDSHPVTLRACHSPWKFISQRTLLGLRTIIASYLVAAAGVSLNYKLKGKDDHSKWRIPFEFETMSFATQLAYHNMATIWTGVHTFHPTEEMHDEDCRGHRVRSAIISFLSPPTSPCKTKAFAFSMFYTAATVIPFVNSFLYYAVLLPTGHGGFKAPDTRLQHPHSPGGSNGGNATGIFYDPGKPRLPSLVPPGDPIHAWKEVQLADTAETSGKGLFAEDDIKPFAILNLWTITPLIAALEVVFMNSIRRQRPVTAHIAGIMAVTGAFVGWAAIGKAATGHPGLFFLDPEKSGSVGASVAGALGLITASAGALTYMYGLTAMREALTAATGW
ncbi:hypothetical protein F5Y18DRAFT_432126 [Xylariaceae sp. FL1019]|nr:hypothetical protein F5Y18DRAFT_432126 [Xylariaceae sp. FL1019]